MDENQNEIKQAQETPHNKYRVILSYSCDNLSEQQRDEKVTRLINGGDGITKVLNHFNIDFYVRLMSDFWVGEPCLESISRIDSQGKSAIIFGDDCLYNPSGEYHILCVLKHHNVLPCSIEETYKIIGRE